MLSKNEGFSEDLRRGRRKARLLPADDDKPQRAEKTRFYVPVIPKTVTPVFSFAAVSPIARATAE